MLTETAGEMNTLNSGHYGHGIFLTIHTQEDVCFATALDQRQKIIDPVSCKDRQHL